MSRPTWVEIDQLDAFGQFFIVIEYFFTMVYKLLQNICCHQLESIYHIMSHAPLHIPQPLVIQFRFSGYNYFLNSTT